MKKHHHALQNNGAGKLRQDRSEFNCIFVHSELDDLGLDPYEFRIYAHLTRRANSKSRAWPGITSMSQACKMRRHTVIRTIRQLEERHLIRVIRKTGALSEYLLTAPSQWKKLPTETSDVLDTGFLNNPGDGKATGVPKRTGSLLDMGVVSQTTRAPVRFGTLKGNPREGNPLKNNTVEVSEALSPTLPPPDQNGRMPGGTPAMSSKRVLKDPSQDPIRRKAFAIAARLEGFHWDNCKVLYAKHTARSYAETALRDGHQEEVIKTAYESALKHCHRVATDEMDRGERFRQEKASPALVVWLAQRELAQDGKTPDQRWSGVKTHLHAKHEERLMESLRVQEEITHQAPQISAWFTRQASNPPPVFPIPVPADPTLNPRFIHE